MPSFNVEKTLPATLTSLCLTDIAEYMDIIVVDDGSSDSTALIANSYASRYPDSVRVITKPNGGHGSAVNAGIAAAQGLYFKVVDGDDRLEADGLRALISVLKATSADLVVAPYRKVPVDGGETENMPFDGVVPGKLYRFSDIRANNNIYFGIHSITIKTSILQEHRVLLQEHTFYVDVEYGLLPIPYVQTVEFLAEYVYLYCVGSAEQSISFANFVKRYDDHYRVVKRMIEFTNSCSTDDAHLAYMYTVLQKICFTNYMLAAFYDEDTSRGKARARDFDSWLRKNDSRLYDMMSKSLYLRFIRATSFHILPRGTRLKNTVKKIYSVFKPITGKKKRFTY